jgi:hypothetical protein
MAAVEDAWRIAMPKTIAARYLESQGIRRLG